MKRRNILAFGILLTTNLSPLVILAEDVTHVSEGDTNSALVKNASSDISTFKSKLDLESDRLINEVESPNLTTEVLSDSYQGTNHKSIEKTNGESRYIAEGMWGDVSWSLQESGLLKIGGGELNEVSVAPWKMYADKIYEIEFDEGAKIELMCDGIDLFQDLYRVRQIRNISSLYINNVFIRNMSYMFSGMSSLQSVELDFLNRVDDLRSVEGMFYGCSSLQSVDLSELNLGNTIDFSKMFQDCTSLKNINWPDEGSGNSRVSLKLSSMFQNCSSLSAFDFKILRSTVKITDMSYMFSGCLSLNQIQGLSDIDTSNVKDMSYMFTNCSALDMLDLSSFNTIKLTNMENAFSNTKLKSIVLGRNFSFLPTAGLPSIPVTDEYTGKWFKSDTATNAWTSDELMSKYTGETDAGTYEWQGRELEVVGSNVEYYIGTPLSELDSHLPIISVKQGGVTLSENDYSVSILNQIDTSKLGEKDLQLRVKIKDSSDYEDITVKANIVWGSTLVVEDQAQKAIDASVSLLHKSSGIPYLNANQGFGTLNPSITSQPFFQVLRNNNENKLIEVTNNSMVEDPKNMAERWNESFKNVSLHYGDVAVMSVEKWGGGENLHGEDTFISRNEKLVKETVGYDNAYYELTANGYRLMHLNQFTVNENKHVPLHTTKEEMNKNISEFIHLPETIEHPENYRIDGFDTIDNSSSGEKSGTVNVYEKLESGGEFKTTYTVNYIVDPEITEHYYDSEYNLLEEKTTSFEYGTSFIAHPEKYREENGILYIYKGWSEEEPSKENNSIHEGLPDPTTTEQDYYYIYEKADHLINVTLPTEIVFGTYDNTQVVTSKAYPIKNNSSVVDLQVDLTNFNKISSDVQLLDEQTLDPTQKEASARLDLSLGDKKIIPGLTENTEEQKLTRLASGQSENLKLTGKYFGDLNENQKVEYNMVLKFKVQKDEKK